MSDKHRHIPEGNGHWMAEDGQPDLVSIIMPTYNRAGLLGETLESVQTQTHRPIELIVIDDGSTDETADLLRRWERGLPDDGLVLRYLRQDNRGAPAARNRGLRESRGQYIQFLDSDDLLHPEKLSRQVAAFAEDEPLDFVYSDFATFSGRPDWDGAPFPGRAVTRLLPEVVRQSVWVGHSGLYRRRICGQVGPWNEQRQKLQDYEYHVRVALLDPRIAYRPGVLSLYRVHDQGAISDADQTPEGLTEMLRVTRDVERLLQDRHGDDPEINAALAARYFGILWVSLRHGMPLIGREAAQEGLRLKPATLRRLKLHTFRCLTLLPPRWAQGICDRMRGVADLDGIPRPEQTPTAVEA